MSSRHSVYHWSPLTTEGVRILLLAVRARRWTSTVSEFFTTTASEFRPIVFCHLFLLVSAAWQNNCPIKCLLRACEMLFSYRLDNYGVELRSRSRKLLWPHVFFPPETNTSLVDWQTALIRWDHTHLEDERTGLKLANHRSSGLQRLLRPTPHTTLSRQLIATPFCLSDMFFLLSNSGFSGSFRKGFWKDLCGCWGLCGIQVIHLRYIGHFI